MPERVFKPITVNGVPVEKLCGNRVPPGTLSGDVPGVERTPEMQEIDDEVKALFFPAYKDRVKMGTSRQMKAGEVIEWDKLVDDNGGKFFGQNTGSCVGTNTANTLMIQIAFECLVLGQREKLDFDYWWPYAYGWGRYFAGMTGEGDGSYLSVQFKAMRDKGNPHTADYDFPSFTTQSDNCRWISSGLEYKWSSRRNIPDDIDPIADDHLLEGAMIRSIDELDHGLDTGPVGYAGMFGTSRVKNVEGVRLAKWDSSWAHCMGFCGKQNHPSLGMLYKVMNRSWGGSQFSTFWIDRKTTKDLLGDGGTELCKIADFDGIEKSGLSIEDILEIFMKLFDS